MIESKLLEVRAEFCCLDPALISEIMVALLCLHEEYLIETCDLELGSFSCQLQSFFSFRTSLGQSMLALADVAGADEILGRLCRNLEPFRLP